MSKTFNTLIVVNDNQNISFATSDKDADAIISDYNDLLEPSEFALTSTTTTLGHVGLPTLEYRTTAGADEFLAVIIDVSEVPKEHPALRSMVLAVGNQDDLEVTFESDIWDAARALEDHLDQNFNRTLFRAEFRTDDQLHIDTSSNYLSFSTARHDTYVDALAQAIPTLPDLDA